MDDNTTTVSEAVYDKYAEFHDDNVIEHPHLVVDRINQMNVRNDDGSALYRYFTTVVYVAIAYMKGLTAKVDNYKTVRDFFEAYTRSIA